MKPAHSASSAVERAHCPPLLPPLPAPPRPLALDPPRPPDPAVPPAEGPPGPSSSSPQPTPPRTTSSATQTNVVFRCTAPPSFFPSRSTHRAQSHSAFHSRPRASHTAAAAQRDSPPAPVIAPSSNRLSLAQAIPPTRGRCSRRSAVVLESRTLSVTERYARTESVRPFGKVASSTPVEARLDDASRCDGPCITQADLERVAFHGRVSP